MYEPLWVCECILLGGCALGGEPGVGDAVGDVGALVGDSHVKPPGAVRLFLHSLAAPHAKMPPPRHGDMASEQSSPPKPIRHLHSKCPRASYDGPCVIPVSLAMVATQRPPFLHGRRAHGPHTPQERRQFDKSFALKVGSLQ